MEIGFDARLISSLGIGRYVSGLLPPLAELLGDRLLVTSRSADLALVRALTAGRVRLTVSNAAPYRIAEQSSFLVALLRAGVKLMHFPHYNLPLLYPRPFVVTIHDLFSFQYPEIHSSWLPRMTNRLLIGNAVRRAAGIITPSHATAQEVSERFPGAAPRITPIAEAAAERFNPTRQPAAEAAWQRYFGVRPPYFLYLGQWKSYKNLPLLIEAFARVHTQRPDAQLVIAGQDSRHPEVPAAAARLGDSIVLPGHLPDDAVADFYRGAVAVVVPSRAEGFGLPVLEAMASGTMVICSDIPVLRELADGVALFCDPSSPDAFATAMLQALNESTPSPLAGEGRGGGSPSSPSPLEGEGRGGGSGIERAGQFSWNKAAQETIAVYERVLAGRPSTRSETER